MTKTLKVKRDLLSMFTDQLLIYLAKSQLETLILASFTSTDKSVTLQERLANI